jgi:peptide-methionine (S)-S-oxide reductase
MWYRKIFSRFAPIVLVFWIAHTGCAQKRTEDNKTSMSKESIKLETATFGAGCFWCVEAIFQQLEGVEKVVSGYSGGHVDKPTYKEICTGKTGHAEVIRIWYDPEVIPFEDLLEVLFDTHDPTTLNRQGNDVGPQYRSAVFYHSDSQRDIATAYIRQLDASGVFKNPIVTEVSPCINFYEAEDYHQNYFNDNGGQPYCAFIIRPKVEKFRKEYGDKLRN